MRPSIALAALALTLGSLTACGSDSGSGSAYCKELKADKAYFKSFSGSNPDVSKLDDAFNRLHSLADKSPDEIKSDWKTLDDAITSITQALKDAGISFGDIAKMQQGQVPKGVDPQKLTDLAPKLQAMGSAKVKKASDAIEKHAKDTCKVTLGSS
jgi:cytochrome c556